MDHGSTVGIVGRLLRLTWEYRARAILLVVLQLALIGFTLLALKLTGLSVDLLGNDQLKAVPVPWGSLGLPDSKMASLLWLGALIVIAAIARTIVSHAHSIQAAKLVHAQVVPELRMKLYDHMHELGLKFFSRNDTSSLVHRLTRDVQMLRSFIDGVVIQGAVLLLTLGSYAGYMLVQHAGLTVATLVLTPLLYLTTLVFLRFARPAYQTERRLADRLLFCLTETIEGIQVVKTFGREAHSRAEFEARNQTLRAHQHLIFRWVSIFTPTIDGLSQASILVLIGYGSYLLSLGAVSLGDLVVFAALLGQFTSRVSEMAGIANTLQQSITGARRVFEVLDAEPEVHQGSARCQLEGDRHAVRFDQVSFGYDEDLVVEDVSFEVPAGHRVAIVGPTGSGKSSLLWLIARFYDPRSGSVSIDGIDLKDLDLSQLRRRIGVVPQNGVLFRATVAENIAFGEPEASSERIERAARRAGAHEFIERLPQGYETKLAEGAIDLSGGQRQRLTLARALLLDPPILLLDDPLAAVDPIMAAGVQKSIEVATRGHTTFIVGARSGLLRGVDEVIFLEGGRVVRREPADELAAKLAHTSP